MTGANRPDRGDGAADGLFAEFGSVGVTGRFAAYRAQAETLAGVEIRNLKPTVIERETLGLAIFEEQFAVVGAVQRLIDQTADTGAVETALGKEYFLGTRLIGH